MLLYPGWSRSWHIQEVNKISTSRSPILLGRSTHQDMAYNCKNISYFYVLKSNKLIHHLGDAETMPKIMKRNVVVIFISLVQKIPKGSNINGEFRTKIVVEIHLLEEEEEFFVLPGTRVKCGHSQPLSDCVRYLCVTAFKYCCFLYLLFLELKNLPNVGKVLLHPFLDWIAFSSVLKSATFLTRERFGKLFVESYQTKKLYYSLAEIIINWQHLLILVGANI